MARRGVGHAEGLDRTAPATVPSAFYVCALGTRDDVEAMLARTDRTTTAGLLLASTSWQCDGDAARAESALRRAAESASAEDRPYVVDMLAPLLISRGLFTRAATFLVTPSSPRFEAGRVALLAVIDAALGNRASSVERARCVRDALARLDDDVARMRIHQRLALAAYWRTDTAEAFEEVAEGLRAARLFDAHRFAVTLHSIAYATHQTCTGDFEGAWRQALALAREATLGGDASYRSWACVTMYELAAERGDEYELLRARAALDVEALPEQYRERFPAGIADALRLSWNGEFATVRNVLTVLKDTPGRTDGERSLCRAMIALVAVALRDDEAARRFTRQAISSSAQPEKRIAAHELRYRRLARIIASVVGGLIGDVVRGRRAAAARFLHGDGDIAALARIATDDDLMRVPQSVRGYGRLILAARKRFEERPVAGPLTATEIEVLTLVAAGRNAPEIGALLGRSPHTVRTHLRNISVKLDTHGRIDTLARARHLGLLGEP